MATKHGLEGTPTYHTWLAIKQRCNNPNNPRFKSYGGRGIKICGRWNDFRNFVADMGLRPAEKLTIDRINNDGDYEPGNCRWASYHQQNRNHRRNVNITFNGKTQCLRDWSNDSGIKYITLLFRLRWGWSEDGDPSARKAVSAHRNRVY
jgi:hypothetical protein